MRDPPSITDDEHIIEVQVLPYTRDLFGCGLPSEKRAGWIARDEVEQELGGDGDDEQDADEVTNSADQVPPEIIGSLGVLVSFHRVAVSR